MFLLYRVLFCNFANSSQFCKTFLGLSSCKRCNIVFFLKKKNKKKKKKTEMLSDFSSMSKEKSGI